MIEKRSVEAFLKVNGIPATAKDEEIRSVLLSARWNNNEVDTALMVLKENVLSNETHVDRAAYRKPGYESKNIPQDDRHLES